MARPPSDIAQRIVTAATERFLHDGVDGASLRQIALAAGTNLGMVYYYFPTKDDLFLAVVERHYAPMSAALIDAISGDRPFDERVRALYDRFGAMSDAEFTVLRLVLREALVSSARLNRLLDRMMHGHAPAMLALLADGIGAGRVGGDVHPAAAMVTMAALAVVPQVMVRRLAASQTGVTLLPPPALATHLAAVALRGIGPAPSPPDPRAGRGETVGKASRAKGVTKRRKKSREG
jgi:AcrR family transcriptional regulator